VQSFIKWVYGLALALGGPGLFVVAFLDSSFIPLPHINDLLVVLMVVRNKPLMPYYTLMATAGSVAGCYVLYLIAERGGEAFLSRRLKAGHIERALALYRKRGVLALIVPALLPPPAPFKLFVLLAGLAEVRPLAFVASIAAARGLRYFVIGVLAVRYGDFALEMIRDRGREVALWVVLFILAAGVAWWLLRRASRGRS
jgi:membrane protein YqaA with SNARE-associated domain